MRHGGFSALELLVTLSLCAILSLIGAPSLSRMGGQLRAAEDSRRCALTLIAARDEAARLRTDVRIAIDAGGLSVDINADDTIEHTLQLDVDSSWESLPTGTITFNGLGLARGIADSITLVVRNRGARSTITVNHNGTVSL